VARIKKVISIVTIGLMLTGCSSINKFTSDLGVNFWSSEQRKAPCMVAFETTSADAVLELPCETEPLEKPTENEIIELRGRYEV